MHLRKITLFPEKYPAKDCYPFNLHNFHITRLIAFNTPVTFFVGENGTGKSTLIEAIARRCNIHIWEPVEERRFELNRYEEELYRFISVEWTDGVVPGSFFASAIFQHFTNILDQWAVASPKVLDYFGGKSLMTQSHEQCHMSYFKSRFQKKGLYLLDEPENALSPKTQLELLNVLEDVGQNGHAQFIIATHSPILLALPDATIYSFDHAPVQQIRYEDTSHYQIYKKFLNDRDTHM